MATIVRGDTLWRISREHLGHGALYRTIFQANAEKIRNPHRIYPGQSLTIP
jgi:nucleoid-associated protein YgaU